MRSSIFCCGLISLVISLLAGCSTQDESPVAGADESATVAQPSDDSSGATNATPKSAPEAEAKQPVATPPVMTPPVTAPPPAASNPPATSNSAGQSELAKLPVPQGVTTVFANADVAIYATEAAVDATKQECRKLLMEQGWRPYGVAGDVQFFTKNRVRLSAQIASAPGQGGKTAISFTKEQLQVDLPAPEETISLQYSDGTKQLLFDTKAKKDEMFAYYRTTLGKTGWEATTERPIEIGLHDSLIFRNPAKDLLTLQVYEVEGITRVTLKHESAAQVAEMERRLDAEIARKNAEKNKPLPKLAIKLPVEAQQVEHSKALIEFQLATGKAKSVVDAWRKEFTSQGWKEDVTIFESTAGSLTFKKDNQSLSLTYLDPGFIPAEVTITASGVELEQPEKK